MSETPDIKIFDDQNGKEDEKTVAIHLNEETVRDRAKTTKELFNSIQDELDQRDEDLKDGLSFLDMKNDTLLSYMIDVCNIVLRKVRGDTIEGHQSVERCVEYRVVLEKIRAIDQKLSYQLNKLITMPEDAEEEDQRVDVRNLDIDLDDEESDGENNKNAPSSDDSEEAESSGQSEDEDDDDADGSSDDYGSDVDQEEDDEAIDTKKDRKMVEKKGNKPKIQDIKPKGVYKPPKLRSVAYLEAGENRSRRKNYDEIYREDEADEIVDRLDDHQYDERRIQFEEDNYTRLPDQNPKKLKRKLKTQEYRRKGRNNKMRRRK